MRNVYIVGVARSPIAAVKSGKKGGPNTSSVSSLSPVDLSVQVLRALFEISGIKPIDLDSFVLGSAISQKVELDSMFQAPAKYIIREASKNNTRAIGTDIEKACSTGLAAIWHAAGEIMLCHAEIAIAGGVDMMSRQPNEIIIEGLTDPTTRKFMAELADQKAKELGFSAEDHDRYARESIVFASSHRQQTSIIPIKIDASEKSTVCFDEEVSILTPDRFDRLQTKRGSLLFPDCEIMTPLNCSKYGDAAAFVALASEEAIVAHSLKPLARIVSYAACGGNEPKNFVLQPYEAITRAIKLAGLDPGGIDFFEVNEAFPTTCVYLMQRLGIAREKMNPWGGAIAHGHPIGATGAGLLTKAVTILKEEGHNRAVISVCNAIDEATAMVIERVGGEI
ncbi:MAG: hypothetical protein A2831_00020 [Candidatus Yanofskybacteria bacterium RIFCSPHIGHO2_01_FULL_44_17]|uniref:Acetyl-CoA acetyltransferase n=1 Tax=Candidatus Yanofskybacteria bacterium RIFCSPHIGHO2_01_FULL_44_17 TaxID=1802668 RepID=A0A1F8EW04_9BACT|nr:MAG: hypothetical protein A2831_00020 [Candidatus Yanofskybacteria bacterium RIFCSPHIGHO2_01_FULL_44_17]